MKAFFQTFARSFANALPFLLCFGAFAAWQEYRDHRDRPDPTPAAVDGAKLGRAYAAAVTSTFADAWSAAADKLDGGGTVADCQTLLQTTWEAKRQAAFAAAVAPDFARVMPTEGTEPTAAQRPAVSKLWRDFAAGLKKGGGR